MVTRHAARRPSLRRRVLEHECAENGKPASRMGARFEEIAQS
jgi:hypothetical protein